MFFKNLNLKQKHIHEWIFYNLTTDDIHCHTFSYQYAVYEFVCKQCEKTKSILQYDLKTELDNANSYIKKMKALGKNIELAESDLTLKPYNGISCFYKGQYVTIVLNKYKEQGFDLKQLPNQ